MWSVSITAIAIISVASLYAFAVYRLRELRGERTERDGEVEFARPMPVEGSDWEFEYLLTSDYARKPR